MVSWIISRLVVLLFGTLYPAYSSYKAVKTKNVKEYIFHEDEQHRSQHRFLWDATGEVDDVLDCVCLFHHCRNTHRHYSFLEIDEYITQARDKSYETMMRVGKRGLNLAANAAVTAAAKGQGVLSEKLRSFSMQDLTLIRDEDAVHMRSHEPQLHPSGGCLLETIEDSASCYSSGEESSVAQRSNGTPSETRTDPSDEDVGDKLPKRSQSLKTPKKIAKAELPVRSVKTRPKKKAVGSLASGESS
ncbi:receptor expression-enhancing protein 2 isoform X7 [Cuculus canorus]|uniref:receptor expression-enhancing protein 2 isoform X7 n=1 Tax=Cuculus canorus TaxID=55661 RepID=UPI0023AAA17A|nr:receptor expression-enhancing protein 2 isoform X7 [Cuculus canorus]